jgi:DnaJ-class molecular chaperone
MSANRYPGTCATCHTRVPAGQGYYDGNLWCAEPVRYDGTMTMCPTAAGWQEASDRKDAERRATQVAPEPTAEEIAQREFYAARRVAWAAEGKRECGRCGGNGGSQAWPGYVCYGCEGRGYKTVTA